MKIFCIAANYPKHNQEIKMKAELEPVMFIKPETAYLKNFSDFYLPEFSSQVEYETEIVLKINKMCKCVDRKFASRYYSELTLGLDITARDIQNLAREKGLPWFLSKGFDFSAPVGDFLPKTDFDTVHDIDFSLKINGEEVQRGNSKDMIFSFDEIVSYISQYVTLKTGDLIFTGTPQGVGKLNIGDILEGFLSGKKVLEINVK